MHAVPYVYLHIGPWHLYQECQASINCFQGSYYILCTCLSWLAVTQVPDQICEVDC